jgi:tRNA threonylcarbamoyladenosine biosynthesis protein TsaB
MRVLALDTTTRAGSTALIADGRVVDERSGDGTRTHALRLPGEIVALAEANGWPLSSIDLYAIASGPGSFTGLRIGIATLQGLALVNGKRIAAVPALTAMAHAASGALAPGTRIAAWMDAHRQDVFAALYEVAGSPSGGVKLIEIEGPTVGRPASTLDRWRSHLPDVIVGDGATRYADAIEVESPVIHVVPHPLIGGTVGLLAAEGAFDALDPAGVRPLYVRRPDVEITRDEKLHGAIGHLSDT